VESHFLTVPTGRINRGRECIDMPEGSSLEIDDLVVLLLGAPAESPTTRDRIEGVTRLEKLIFLLERETDLKNVLKESADFKSHNFGPFSSKIYQAVDTLAAYGLLEDSADLSTSTMDSWEAQNLIGGNPTDPYASRTFTLTKRGRRYYEALAAEIPPGYLDELSRLKDRFATLPLRQLIRYVYQRYPNYTDRSLIREDILG
jgi:uncharacterized protein